MTSTPGRMSAMPYFVVREAPRFIDFLERAFLAEVLLRVPGFDASIAHAEVRIGDSLIGFSESFDRDELTRGATMLHTDDVDATYWRAMEAGANSLRGPADQARDGRIAEVVDWWGNRWLITSR